MRRLRRTSLITFGCLSVLVGIGLSRKVQIDFRLWWLLLTPLLALVKAKNITALLLIIVLGLSIGLWRGGVYYEKLGLIKTLNGQKITIQAFASSDSVYGNSSQIEFVANHIKVTDSGASSDGTNLAGQAKISGFGVPMVYRGDLITATGKIYPMRGSNQMRMAYSQLSIMSHDSSRINKMTRQFSAGMQNALPEPLASFGMGLLIGQRATLPDYALLALSMVGLTHIIAVSGYNLTIIVRAVANVKIFGSKFQKLAVSLSLIILFVLITGFSASIVRASLVSVLGLWAWYYGRNLRPLLVICLVAALTGLYNPFYVWGDIGWYLSFLAFFGVLILAPMIHAKLLPNKEPKGLLLVITETFAAYIMTLPLIMFVFGKLSVVALVANLLVIPLVPFAMLFSAIAGIAGMLTPALAGWLAIPARLILGYILDVAYYLSSLSYSQIVSYMNVWQMLVAYAAMGLFVLTLYIKYARQRTKNTLNMLK